VFAKSATAILRIFCWQRPNTQPS